MKRDIDLAGNIFPLLLEEVCFARNGTRIVDQVSLCLDGMTRTVILGANGAGKSVTMRLMHGLLAASSGRITWGGSAIPPNAQAMVFQRPLLLRTSALKNITYGLRLAGVARELRAPRAREALRRVGLAHLAERPGRVLSAGEQQRIAIARAWALEPQVLFLDEPTASLDPTATREIERIVAEIAASGCKIVMATHNLGQARRLADDVVFLDRGRVVEHTGGDEFFRQPRSVEANAFMKGELPWT